MATTDYFSLLIAQRMAVTHDIQPLISPLFAPTQLPASERLRFVEDNEDLLAPPILPVQLLEQEQYSAVARTLFDGPLKRPPQFTTPSSSPASPSSDEART